jgi:hypothetical protein
MMLILAHTPFKLYTTHHDAASLWSLVSRHATESNDEKVGNEQLANV